MTRRILVTGSRSWTDTGTIREALAAQWGDGTAVLITGACPRGADRLAEQCWRAWGGRVARHPADWTRHGRGAGFRRNAAMVAAGADVCLVFHRDNSPGTRHTADLATRAGIPLQRFAHPAGQPASEPDRTARQPADPVAQPHTATVGEPDLGPGVRELAVLADGPWAARWYWRADLEAMQQASRRMGYPDTHPSAVLRGYHPTDDHHDHPTDPDRTGRAWRYQEPTPNRPDGPADAGPPIPHQQRRCAMTMYQITDAAGRVYRIAAPDPATAMQRIADLHQVAVVALRDVRGAGDNIVVGSPGPEPPRPQPDPVAPPPAERDSSHPAAPSAPEIAVPTCGNEPAELAVGVDRAGDPAARWELQMPAWMRERAARTAAEIAAGTAPALRPDDPVELAERIGQLRAAHGPSRTEEILTPSEAAQRLTQLGHDRAAAQQMVTDYLHETSHAIGAPVYQWGLDQHDVDAIAERHDRTCATGDHDLTNPAQRREEDFDAAQAVQRAADDRAGVPTAAETVEAIARAADELRQRYLPGDPEGELLVDRFGPHMIEPADTTADHASRPADAASDPWDETLAQPLPVPSQRTGEPVSDPDTHRTIGAARDRSGSQLAHHVAGGAGEQHRREQLARWHADDHPADSTADDAGTGDPAAVREC